MKGFANKNEPTYIDSETWQGGMDKFSFRLMVLWYVHKIGDLAAREFRGGFYMQVETKAGQLKEVYVEDTRETYSNAVQFLHNLLEPHFDNRMKIMANKFMKLVENNEKEFIDKSVPEEDVILGENFYTEQKDKVLLEQYKQKKAKLYIRYFMHISRFLHRLNYLEGKKFSEGI
jgi:hypothetical protein